MKNFHPTLSAYKTIVKEVSWLAAGMDVENDEYRKAVRQMIASCKILAKQLQDSGAKNIPTFL